MSEPQMIIGVCGHIGTGKDATAEYLRDIFLFRHMYFAEKLKTMCADLYDIEPRLLFGTQEDKSEPLPHLGVVSEFFASQSELWQSRVGEPWCGRYVLQWMGTDACRSVYGPVWVNALKREIQADTHHAIVVSDVRFQNEADMIRSLGGVIARTQIEGETMELVGHESEDWVVTMEPDYDLIAPKPGLQKLHEEIQQMVAKEMQRLS